MKAKQYANVPETARGNIVYSDVARQFPVAALNMPAYSFAFAAPTKGIIYLVAFTATASTAISSISFFSQSITPVNYQNTYVGIYSFNGALEATSAAISTPALGAQVICPVSSQVTRGTKYWIAIQFGASTTTVGRYDSKPNFLDPVTMPALGCAIDTCQIQSVSSTFDSVLPLDLSGVAFTQSNFPTSFGIA